MKSLSITILLLGAVALASAQSCKYLKFSKDHTGCKDKNPKCKIIESGVTKDQIKEILDVHNKLRNQLANGDYKSKGFPSASNMMELKWNDEIAAIAQKHADQCKFDHDCDDCRKVDAFEVGQNLFTKSTTAASLKVNWTEGIQEWFDEINICPKNVIAKFAGGEWGHFTAMSWADTAFVGCGFSSYSRDDPKFKTGGLYTCNYGSAGNWVGEAVYKSGSPASACPKGKSKSKSYSSLCA